MIPRGLVTSSPEQIERFALALEAINESVYDWDLANGTFEHLPLADTSMKRWVEEPRTPEQWLDTIHWDDQLIYAKAVRAHLAGHTARLLCEYRYKARDGSWRWARQQGVAVRGRGGAATRIVGSVGDITAQKEREAELEAARAEAAAAHAQAEHANELMHTVLDNMSDGVLLLDRNFDWLMANRSLISFPAFPKGFAQVGMSGYDLLRYQAERGEFGIVDDIEAAVAERAKLMRTPGGISYSRWMDGGYYIELKFTPLPDGRLLAVYRDLTALKNSEEVLKKTEERLRDAVEYTPEGFAVFGPDRRLLMSSRAYAEIFPMVAEWSMPGLEIADIVRAVGRAGVVPSLVYGNVDAHIGFWTSFVDDPDHVAEINLVDRCIHVRGRKTAEGNSVFIYNDVTQMKAREAALQRVEGQLRDAIEYQSGGFALYDEDLRLITCNSAFAGLVPNVPEWRTPGLSLATITKAVANADAAPNLSLGDVERYVEYGSADGTRPDRPLEMQLGDGRWVQVEARKTAEGNTVVVYNDLTKLKEREDALSTAEKRLRDAVENQAGGFALYSPDLKLITCNSAFAKLVPQVAEWRTPGLSLEASLQAVAARGGFKGLDETSGPKYVERWLRYMRDPDRPVELRIAKDRWVQLEARKTADGNTVVLFSDLSALKQRERELAQAQLRLTEAIDNQSGGFALYDASLRLITCNTAFANIAPHVPEWTRPGAELTDILTALAKRGGFPGLERVSVDDYVNYWLDYMAKPDRPIQLYLGKDRWFQVEGRKTPAGNTVVLFNDLSKLKQRETELATVQERLTQAIANLVDGFAYFDADERLVICNDAYANFMQRAPKAITPGYTLEEGLRERFAIGPPVAQGIDLERYIQGFLSLHRSGSANVEVPMNDGRFMRIRNRATPDGGIVVVVADISELRQRAVELEKARDIAESGRIEAQAANQSKSTFLATMSHEIRTPMNGVLGMMEILEHQGLNEDQRRTVGTMRDSAHALLRIIDDVLDFSKIEAGRLELEETAFSLSGLIESVVATFATQVQSKGLRLIAEIRPDSYDLLVGDPTRVRQILFNLLGNALKFTERGSVRVEVGTSPVGDGRARVVLGVHDTGIGLDDEERGRLFQPFAQADTSTTRRFGGSGLGLSIVRRLAQLMGGDVAVSSRPGVGSTFEVSLVLAAAPAESPLHAVSRRAPAKLPVGSLDATVRLLVVDDHPVNRDVLVMQLGLMGLSAETANDGCEGLELWAPGKYAVVLADIHMPHMDGYEMTRQLRAREGDGLRTPIVAVTANAMKGEEARCHEAGMDGYLAKPVSLEQLRATLARWLSVDAVAASRQSADAAAHPAAIDRDVLAAWLGDDSDAIDGLLRKFRKTAVEAEREIDVAFRAGDLAVLSAYAHRLKGAAQTVGAVRLGAAASVLEQGGKAGDRIKCRDGLGALASEMRGVLAELPSA